jgi:hypothetical protein
MIDCLLDEALQKQPAGFKFALLAARTKRVKWWPDKSGKKEAFGGRNNACRDDPGLDAVAGGSRLGRARDGNGRTLQCILRYEYYIEL